MKNIFLSLWSKIKSLYFHVSTQSASISNNNHITARAASISNNNQIASQSASILNINQIASQSGPQQHSSFRPFSMRHDYNHMQNAWWCRHCLAYCMYENPSPMNIFNKYESNCFCCRCQSDCFIRDSNAIEEYATLIELPSIIKKSPVLDVLYNLPLPLEIIQYILLPMLYNRLEAMRLGIYDVIVYHMTTSTNAIKPEVMFRVACQIGKASVAKFLMSRYKFDTQTLCCALEMAYTQHNQYLIEYVRNELMSNS